MKRGQRVQMTMSPIGTGIPGKAAELTLYGTVREVEAPYCDHVAGVNCCGTCECKTNTGPGLVAVRWDGSLEVSWYAADDDGLEVVGRVAGDGS